MATAMQAYLTGRADEGKSQNAWHPFFEEAAARQLVERGGVIGLLVLTDRASVLCPIAKR